jgi:NTP pyrophosphatase (non-canonical NTP hydrolase)
VSPELDAALKRAREWHETATAEEKAAMWQTQRESIARSVSGPTDGCGTTFAVPSDSAWQPRSDRTVAAGRERHREDNAVVNDSATGSGDFAFGSTIWPGMAKLIEECGEVVQVGGKLMQRGGRTEHWSGDLLKMLTEEIADVIAAATIVIELNAQLDTTAIAERITTKLDTFRGWHRDNLGNPAS